MGTTEKNIGEQIGDAISEAIRSEDYSNLKSTVEQAISEASRAVSSGLEQAARDSEDARARRREREALAREEERARAEARRQEYERRNKELAQKREVEASINARFADVAGKKRWAIALCVLWGLGIFSGLDMLVNEIGFSLYGYIFWDDILNAVIVIAINVGLFAWSFSRFKLLKSFETYKHILGTRESCTVDELSSQTSKPADAVVKSLRKMIAKGFFKQGHINDRASFLMVTDAEYALYRRGLEAAYEYDEQDGEGEGGSSAPAGSEYARAYAVGAADAGRRRSAPESISKSKKGKDGTAEVELSPRVRAVLKRGDDFMAEIRSQNAAIPGEEVTRKIDQIELVLNSIFSRAKEHPEVVDELDRLMDYYLPTTVKLLDAYRDLDAQPIQGGNIAKSKRDIEETLDALNVAFEKLLDSIFDDVAWDISTDVSVLQTVLAQEGLTKDPFKDSNHRI